VQPHDPVISGTGIFSQFTMGLRSPFNISFSDKDMPTRKITGTEEWKINIL
jgi:hypothetical protein